jgi:hypothetical protein
LEENNETQDVDISKPAMMFWLRRMMEFRAQVPWDNGERETLKARDIPVIGKMERPSRLGGVKNGITHRNLE